MIYRGYGNHEKPRSDHESTNWPNRTSGIVFSWCFRDFVVFRAVVKYQLNEDLYSASNFPHAFSASSLL
jgi:hypothetical protein